MSEQPEAKGATQTFTAPVDYAAGHDVHVTQHLYDRLGPELTPTQRWELHSKVKRLERDFGESGQQVWIDIHAALGTRNIDDLRLAHFRTVSTLIDLMTERAELRGMLNEVRDQSDVIAKMQADADSVKALLQGRDDEFNQLQRQLRTVSERLLHQNKQLDELTRVSVKAHSDLQQAQAELTTARAATKKAGGKKLIFFFFLLATAAIGWSTFQDKQHQQALTAVNDRLTVCEFAGQAYSWGTRLNLPDGRIKCVKSRNGQYMWQADR